MSEKFVFRGADAQVSTTASNAGTGAVFVMPSSPDPALHPPAAQVTLVPHPGHPAWVSPPMHDHLGLPIEAIIFAGSIMVIAAWYVAHAQFEASKRLIR